MGLLQHRRHADNGRLLPRDPQNYSDRMVLPSVYSTDLKTQLRYVPDAHFYSGTDICLGNFLGDRNSDDHFRIGSLDFPVLCRHSTADLFLAEKQISDRLTIFFISHQFAHLSNQST